MYARQAGLLADQPADFAVILSPGQRTPTELVDRYQVGDAGVRSLFIDYLTERQTCWTTRV